MVRLPAHSTVILIVSFLLGLFFVFAVPPFQKPDEMVHYYKAVSLASGNILCRREKKKIFNPIARYLFTFPDAMLASHIAANTNMKFTKQLYLSVLAKPLDTRLVQESSSCTLPFILYIVPAIAIAIPVFLHANPLIIFFVGRLAAFLVGFFLLWYSWRVAPRTYKPLFLFLVAIPTVLFQLSSYSKDALHLSLGFLAFSYWLGFRTRTTPLTLRSFVVFFAALILAILARPTYAPLVLIIFLIPDATTLVHRLNKKPFFIVILTSILTTGILSGAIFLTRQYVAKASFFLSTPMLGFVNPALQLRYLAMDPWRILVVLGTTFEQSFGLYVRTAVGVTGWIGAVMPWWVNVLYVGWFFYLIFSLAREKEKARAWELIVVCVSIVGVLSSLFISLYIFSTPVAAPIVDGVTGRYFLILLPLVIWFVACIATRAKRFVVYGLCLAVVATVGVQIYERYYHYDAYIYQGTYQVFSVNKKHEFQKIPPAFEQKEIVTPGKKIAGVALYMPPQKDFQQHPYLVSLRDAECNLVLGEAVMDMSQLPVSKFWWIHMPPVETNQSTVCVHIELFGEKQAQDKYMELVYDPKQKNFVMSLLYVY